MIWLLTVHDGVDGASGKLLSIHTLILGEIGALFARTLGRILLAGKGELILLQVDGLDLACHRVPRSQLLRRILDELVADLRYMQKAIGCGA